MIRSDWNEEMVEECVPELFAITIGYTKELEQRLTQNDIKRLDAKLHIVCEMAAKLAANMLKGTLKYESDEYPIQDWLEYLVDDATDALNYAFFAKKKLVEMGYTS